MNLTSVDIPVAGYSRMRVKTIAIIIIMLAMPDGENPMMMDPHEAYSTTDLSLGMYNINVTVAAG